MCTTAEETDEFYTELYKLYKSYGFRVNCSLVGDKSKNPWAIYNKTLLAHDAVLKNTLLHLTEKFVIFVDGDTFVDGDLEVLCGAMEENNFDIASVKVLPSKRTNVIEHLQGVEYDIAMQARLIYPWLTSGAGMVAKREVMTSVMKNHSLFFNGGDIEIGKLADMMGYKVGHIPMVFYTDIPDTVGKWIKQRFSWMCGCFRHSIVNWHHNLRHPFHFIYFSFVIYFLYPYKIISMLSHWHVFPFIIGLYIVITYLANWKVRSRWMLLFPFYALFQILVIIWFGVFRYLKTVIKSGNIGIIRMRHNPNRVSLFKPKYAFAAVSNLSIIFVTLGAILLGTNGFAQQLVLGRRYESIEFVQAGYKIASYQTNNLATSFLSPRKAQQTADEEVKEGEVAGYALETKAEDEQVEIKKNEDTTYSITVEVGDSAWKIARKAIKRYSEESGIELSESQRLYAEDTLKDEILSIGSLRPATSIIIEKSLVAEHIQTAIETLPDKYFISEENHSYLS
ncbi:MAG: glycosyltransferase family 2 protein [Candidatus Bathyarchaeia archaeon]